MDYVNLGKSDLKISQIGLGTWQFGTQGWGFNVDFTEDDAVRTVQRALDLGVNWIDTAEVYGGGRSEEIIAKAIKGRRNELVIATKVAGQHLAYDEVLNAAEGSLRRLGVTSIDLYQVHWPSRSVPISETMRALEKLVDNGKIRYIGVSNFDPEQLRQAQNALSRHEIVSDQVLYNILQREIEKELLPYAKHSRISIIAYSPLAQGLLTGKYDLAHLPSDSVRSGNPLFNNKETLGKALKVVEVVKQTAKLRGKTPAQVALNWLIRDPGVLAIPGAKKPAQIEETAGASGWRLSEKEAREIEEAARVLVAK